ncbi:cyclin-dependent kinase 5 activator 2b [Lampris incognitus]|uniref:cyclin-dependent kinase 5 activator 2b n=1 Tax=Lampris incognitus TaxID=2546036 RepID=UPI0024B57A6F|nr:cyclin-dependent kinase 5 activator 2b [Lampris incognitus]
MGTVLSISPLSKKGSIMDSDAAAGGPGLSAAGKNDKSVKRHSMLVSALTWRKLMTSSAKKKSAKKVSPNPPPPSEPPARQVAQLNNENTKKSRQTDERKPKAPIPVPVPTVPNQNPQPAPTQIVLTQSGKLSSIRKQPSSLSIISPRRVIVQASTGELLRCLGDFMCRRCSKLKELTCADVILWFRNIDRTLLIQGWQDQGFITPANLVFVYLLCQDTVTDDVDSAYELQGVFHSCLYLAYSYMGNEISYPLKPFMIEANKEVFWERSLSIIDRMSAKMLLLNSDPHFFTEVFQDLKDQREESGESNPDR